MDGGYSQGGGGLSDPHPPEWNPEYTWKFYQAQLPL